MKALILAAGIGKRLKTDTPKILLQIGKKTLLERHYTNLVNANIHKIGTLNYIYCVVFAIIYFCHIIVTNEINTTKKV